ncbi:MAG: transglutaminase family protein [Verrucomicrobiota bacterium]
MAPTGRAMIFNIVHTTAYEYSAPAIESFTELRVRPRESNRQIVHHHVTEVTPRAALEEFTDYYDNAVECLSVPFRHKTLAVTSRSTVETLPHKDAISALDLTVSEAVRINWPQRRELFDFLMPSRHAPINPELEQLSRELLPSSASFAESILGLNSYIFEKFTYMPGVTDVRTPLADVLRKRQGVCQDFAHLMIALIRCAGLPARYVSGYLETESVRGEGHLVGATASHAWVEGFSAQRHVDRPSTRPTTCSRASATCRSASGATIATCRRCAASSRAPGGRRSPSWSPCREPPGKPWGPDDAATRHLPRQRPPVVAPEPDRVDCRRAGRGRARRHRRARLVPAGGSLRPARHRRSRRRTRRWRTSWPGRNCCATSSST